MSSLSHQYERIRKLLITRSLQYGAQLGLAQSPLIPARLKRAAGKKSQQLAPVSGSFTHLWESTVFEKFWFGRFDECLADLEIELHTGKISGHRLDFITRLMWHGVSNKAWSVTEHMQQAWEIAVRRHGWDTHTDKTCALGQWLAAQEHSQQSCITWNPHPDVIVFAQLSLRAEIRVSPDDIVQSKAAIRFLSPEWWLAGHSDTFIPALQDELASFARWVASTGDDLLKRHLDRCMRVRKLLKFRYLVTEGDESQSDLRLLLHGPTWEAPSQSMNYSGQSHHVLYTMGAAIPWQVNGYTTRSHALLRELNTGGWTVPASTKLAHAMTYVPREGAPEPSHDVIEDGVTYLSYSRLTIGRPSWSYYLRCNQSNFEHKVNKQRPEVIHAASTWIVGIPSRNVANTFGLPMIYEVRGFPHISTSSMKPGFGFTATFRLHHAMEIAVAKAADHVFAITDGVKQILVDHGVQESKISLLPNGVNRDRFMPQPRDVELETRYALQQKTVIGYAGSLVGYEGLDLLIDAFAKLAKHHLSAVLMIVGDGPLLTELKHQAHALGLSERVVFKGAVQPDLVERYYSLMDIVPFPRLGIPVCEIVSPMKPFEALAMEKAVIVSNVKALTDIVKDGERGLVFTKNSSESLYQALALLIRQPELSRRLGKNGRQWVLQSYTWENHAKHVHDIYEELTAQRVEKG